MRNLSKILKQHELWIRTRGQRDEQADFTGQISMEQILWEQISKEQISREHIVPRVWLGIK